jgi:hypothetical protein
MAENNYLMKNPPTLLPNTLPRRYQFEKEYRGGSLEHQNDDINDHLGVDSGNVDVCVPKTKCRSWWRWWGEMSILKKWVCIQIVSSLCSPACFSLRMEIFVVFQLMVSNAAIGRCEARASVWPAPHSSQLPPHSLLGTPPRFSGVGRHAV